MAELCSSLGANSVSYRYNHIKIVKIYIPVNDSVTFFSNYSNFSSS